MEREGAVGVILNADARAIPLADEVVQTVVTSPPYWGLRDYGIKDGIGLEESPEAWVEQMVQVFREVRRVLRPDGTVWLNVGDAYCTMGGARTYHGIRAGRQDEPPRPEHTDPGKHGRWNRDYNGLKPKDLIGLPWRLAFALQADGWWLRSDVVWSKPNPMPESVTDRPAKAHESLFLLTKSPRYFYDADAVREEASPASIARINQSTFDQQEGGPKDYARTETNRNRSTRKTLENFAKNPGRNLRTVWTVPTQPFPDAHFATFPEALVLPCIRAGTSEKGACGECGAPWERVTERTAYGSRAGDGDPMVEGFQRNRMGGQHFWDNEYEPPRTTGWQPTCDHETGPVPCIVLDPFAGSGTTGIIARKLGRRFVGLDLSEDYCRMARRRIRAEGRVQTKGAMKKLDPDRYEEVGLL